MGHRANGEAKVTILDLRIASAVLICFLSSTLLNHLGIMFTVGETRLEIIQKMTACISCILVCQDTVAFSKTAGKNRLIITLIGGLTGILISLIDTFTRSEWLMGFLVASGVLLALYLCKRAGVPYVNARIGGVTCVLVACTPAGNSHVWYAVFRLVGTLYGALVSVLVTMAFARWGKNKN